MLRFLLNNTDQPRTYEIVEYPDDSNNGVPFATITCSELTSMRIIRALNATSAAGQATSEAKAEAARANGAKGGRPRKAEAPPVLMDIEQHGRLRPWRIDGYPPIYLKPYEGRKGELLFVDSSDLIDGQRLRFRAATGSLIRIENNFAPAEGTLCPLFTVCGEDIFLQGDIEYRFVFFRHEHRLVQEPV